MTLLRGYWTSTARAAGTATSTSTCYRVRSSSLVVSLLTLPSLLVPAACGMSVAVEMESRYAGRCL